MKSNHRPPHLSIDNTIYFISASTIDHKLIFKSAEHMSILVETFDEALVKHGYEKIGWVFLANHYHTLVKVSRANVLPKFINFLHGKSSHKINEFDMARGRKIWYQYWDACVRTEHDFYTRLNYIHQNAVKHRVAENMQDYPWSSYKIWEDKLGQKGMAECFERHPAIDFTLPEEVNCYFGAP